MRSYGETVEVRTVLDTERGLSVSTGLEVAPAQFLWRGRLYVIRAVLAHWVELGTWWSSGSARPQRLSRPSPVAGRISGQVSASTAERDVDALPERRSVAIDVGAVEREVWRVEARAGRSGAVGVYDLVHDIPAALALQALPALSAGPTTAAPDEPGPLHPVPTRWRLARALD